MKLSLFHTIFLLLALVGPLYGQQEPLFQQNYLNPFVYNPAYAGSNNLTEIGAFRNQKWVDFDGGIISNLVNVHSRINNSNSSIGLQLNTDNIGFSARTKAHIAYAYRITLSETAFLQPGFSIGIVDQRFNFNSIVGDFADPVLAQTFDPNRTGFDANFGIFLKIRDFKLGVSVPQLLANSLLLNKTEQHTYQLERQFILNTSYIFYANSKRSAYFQPDILLIHSPQLPFHYSASLLAGLTKVGWIGATYKSDYAVGATIGINLFEQLKVGFAYDIPIGQMTNITNSNNFEVAVVYQFGKSKSSSNPQKNETSALENRLQEVVRQQEIKDSIYDITIDSLNTELNIKQLENKVLADENILIKDNSLTVVSDTSRKVAEQVNSIANSTVSTAENNKNNGNQKPSSSSINEGKNIKINQAPDVSNPKYVQNIQTQSIKIKDDFFTEVLNDQEAPDGYYVVTGMYESQSEAERLLNVAKSKFDSPKLLVNKRNNKYYVVLYYSESIDGVIEALMESNTINTPGFGKAWALNYFKRD